MACYGSRFSRKLRPDVARPFTVCGGPTTRGMFSRPRSDRLSLCATFFCNTQKCCGAAGSLSLWIAGRTGM